MNCDAIARHYAWIEFAAFGKTLQRCRFHFLDQLTDTRRALVLGDGDGRFLVELLRACPQVSVDYVDRSAAMLALARQRAGSDRVRYHHADVLTEALPGVESGAEYDLVVTHFFLDCFAAHELASVIRRVGSVAAKDARWVISEFRIPPGRLFAIFARRFIGLMYAFFRWATGLRTTELSDHRPLLTGAGFVLRLQTERAGGLLASELWQRPVE
ncbi:MAG: class I SAM-dependent methyltransferase [Acidobacteriota bacterium]